MSNMLHIMQERLLTPWCVLLTGDCWVYHKVVGKPCGAGGIVTGVLDHIQMQWKGVKWQERIWYQPAGAAAAEKSSCKTASLKVCTIMVDKIQI